MFSLTITCSSLDELERVVRNLRAKEAVVGVIGTTELVPTSAFPAFAIVPDAPATPAKPELVNAPPRMSHGDVGPASVFAPQPAPTPAPAPIPNAVPPAPVATAPTSAPTQPVATAASPTPAGVEVDPRGFPWDARIHSSSKARLAKSNCWKYIRGVDEDLVAKVEDELRAQGYGQVSAGDTKAPAPTPGLSAPAAPAPAPAPEPAASAPATPAPAAPPTPAPAPPTPAAPSGPNGKELMGRFSSGLMKKKVDGPWVTATLAHYGIKNLPDVMNHPDKWQDIKDFLDRPDVGL